MSEEDNLKFDEPMISQGRWSENEISCGMKRLSDIATSGVAIFVVVYFIFRFTVTGDPKDPVARSRIAL